MGKPAKAVEPYYWHAVWAHVDDYNDSLAAGHSTGHDRGVYEWIPKLFISVGTGLYNFLNWGLDTK